MNNQLCKDNIICCDDNCQRCANLIYNKYVELQEENKRLKQEYEPVRHGKWIDDLYAEKCGDAYCSECNHFDWSNLNYCPNCGARMDGGNSND